MRNGTARLWLGVVLTLLVLATGRWADAEGITRVQQSDGSVQVYRDVRMRFVGETLWITTADRHGVLEIANGACSFARALQRCLPYAMTLHQHGSVHPIAIDRGTVYLNPTDAPHRLPHSSDRLAPRDVLVALRTARGTYVSVRGTLDKTPR